MRKGREKGGLMDTDRIDAELIDDVIRMPGWELIWRRLVDERDRRIRSMIDDSSGAEFKRGFIQGLEVAMKIPKIVADEAIRTAAGKKK